MRGRLFCFGFGYSAQRLAGMVLERGWTVAGTSRSPDPASVWAERGVTLHRFDREHPLPAPAETLDGVTHILVSVPPDDQGDPVVDRHGADLARLPGLAWIGYLSTTGVYGDQGGDLVDEATPVAPVNLRGERRVTAEAAWLDAGRIHGLPAQVFRLGGIYGPGRSALERLKTGTARRVDRPGHAFSRIHVDDIAGALFASMERPEPGSFYNLCDDEPAPQARVIEFAADLLGITPPPLEPFETAQLTPMAREFYLGGSRRVSNAKLKESLGIALRYPTYREGLRACLEAGL